MNRRSLGFQLSKAFVGFERCKAAEGLSPHPLASYKYYRKLHLEFAGDVNIADMTARDVRAFLAWLRTDHRSRQFSRDTRPLSRKTIRNDCATLSGIFRWAALEFGLPNPLVGVPAPKFEKAPVEPFAKKDVVKLLKACKMCRESTPFDRRGFTSTRPTFRRH